jgi:hypothetical protein
MAGWWFQTFFIFPDVGLMSSSQLTFTPSFFRGVGSTTKQIIVLNPMVNNLIFEQ